MASVEEAEVSKSLLFEDIAINDFPVQINCSRPVDDISDFVGSERTVEPQRFTENSPASERIKELLSYGWN